MEAEAAPAVEANFRAPETRGNFSVDAPADSGLMDADTPEFAAYKQNVEAADALALADVRADIAAFLPPIEHETPADIEPFMQAGEDAPAAGIEQQFQAAIEGYRATGKWELGAISEAVSADSPEFQGFREQMRAEEQQRLVDGQAREEAAYREAVDNWKQTGEWNLRGVARPLENFEVDTINGKDYFTEYVPKNVLGETIYGMAYGAGTGNHAQVREDLRPHAKRFVKAHELYHLQDTKGGTRQQRENRADLYGFRKEPIGFFATEHESVKNTFSRAFQRIRKTLMP